MKTINLINLSLLLYSVTIPDVIACSCTFPDDIADTPLDNPTREVRTAGVGYVLELDGKFVFKFLACYNRKDCKDFAMKKVDGHKKETIEARDKFNLIRIYSYYNSFEEANFADIKKNTTILKKDTKEKNTWCNCPSALYSSIISQYRLPHYFNSNYIATDVNKIDSKLFLESKEMRKCSSCKTLMHEDLVTNEKSDVLYGKLDVLGSDVYFTSANKRQAHFRKTFRKIKLTKGTSCFPVLKDKDFSSDIFITFSNSPNIKNNSLDHINLCEVKISDYSQYEPFPYTTEEMDKLLFFRKTKCKTPELNDDFLKNIKTFIYGQYKSSNGTVTFDKDYLIQAEDLIVLKNKDLAAIYDKIGIIDIAFASTEALEINSRNAFNLHNECSSIFIPEYKNKDYEVLFKVVREKLTSQIIKEYGEKIRKQKTIIDGFDPALEYR